MSTKYRFNHFTLFFTTKVSHSISLLLTLFFGYCSHSSSREYFNPALLETTGGLATQVDLSQFESGMQSPGNYRVNVLVNQQMVDAVEINFSYEINDHEETVLGPCLTLIQLKSWGVNTDKYPTLATNNSQCVNLNVIDGAKTEFLFNEQTLTISIPQASMMLHSADYIAPEKWDEGINAFLLNYTMNGSTTRPKQSISPTVTTQYGNFHPGINIGSWRLRNYSTWNHDNRGKNEWDSIYNYASRNIKRLQGQFIVGDSNSPAEVFDSIAFRGVQLASDKDMTPDSLKGYAPTIRGIARSNAEVTVYQNGHSIYQTSVSPGAFEINDMYPTGGAGDMQVTIKESDGSEQHLIVPYASLPVLHRENSFEYSITGGKTRLEGSKEASFGQLTLIYGLPFGVTLYGGLQQANVDYSAAALGAGTNLGDIGAISADVTYSHAKKNMDNAQNRELSTETGQSLRLRYSKNFLKTGTNLAISGYRYSTKGYYTLAEIMVPYDSESESEHRKNRIELSLSQDITFGSVAVSYMNEHYWDHDKASSLNFSYNNSFSGISYGINYAYNINYQQETTSSYVRKEDDQQISLNFSIPLDNYLSGMNMNYSMSNSSNGPTTYNIEASGTAFEDRSLNWDVQEGYSGTANKTNGSLYADYKSRYAEINGGYSYDMNAKRLNYGMQGGLLVHRNGLTLSQPFNDTIILINTNGAANVPVSSQTGIKTDSDGFAVVPYASPYRKNRISLDTENLTSNTVELEETTKNVIPTRGAVVEAGYNTSIGERLLLTLLQKNGTSVPFGAIVSTQTSAENSQQRSGLVGNSGQVYLTGLTDQRSLLVKWGKEKSNQCTVNFDLPKTKRASGIFILHEKCL